MEMYENSELNALILNCLSENMDFQQLICKVAEKFNVDIAIVTIDGRPLFKTGELIYTESIRYSRISEKSTVYMCPLKDSSFRIGTTILSDELPYGAVLVTCPDGTDIQLAAAIAMSLSKTYQYYFNLKDQEQVFPFVNQIIAHYLLSENYLPFAYDYFSPNSAEFTDHSPNRISFRSNFAIAAFRSASPQQSTVPDGAIAQFSKYNPNSYCIKKGDSILAFIYGLDGDSARNNKLLISAIDSFCKSFSMVSVVSGVFSDLAARRSALQQVSLLISHIDHFVSSGSVVLAEEHHKEMILFAALEVSDPKVFRLTDIEQLAEHDRTNGTEYLVTLESYLRSSGHFTKASKMLFVDRGTLKYRMNKIRTMLSCDPDDPRAAKRLLLAIDMRNIANSVKT